MPIFDAHLDLAFLAETGRDMHAPLETCRGRYQPAGVTLQSLREGGVTHCLGTIFTEAIDPSDRESEDGAWAYPMGDAEAAHVCGLRQLKLYQAWASAGVIALMPRVDRLSEPMRRPIHDSERIQLGILMECADPIRGPEEVEFWAEGGVIAVGLAWWRQGRYAGGNGTNASDSKAGLTGMGRGLVAELDRHGVVHDLSHLSQRATDDLLEATDAVVMASHSNCRALLGGEGNPEWQRHLSDETIREITRRGGVIGLNLIRNFIKTGLDRKDPNDRPSIDDCVAHVEHVCEIAGDRWCVGLGSDMDGGVPTTEMAAGIDSPGDFSKLGEALAQKGWSDGDVEGFLFGNWGRFWGSD